MTTNDQLSKDDPRYQARLNAQHGIILGVATLPLSIIMGFFFALPFAQTTEGFPLAIIPVGVSTVLIFLGVGLYVLALAQGLLPLVEQFWNLRSSIEEISVKDRLTWQTALAGLLFLGLGVGFGICFLSM